MKRVDLSAELAAAGSATKVLHFHALERFGIARNLLCDLWRSDFGFGVCRARDVGDGLYSPGEGEPHLVLPVREDGDLVDLCAFRSSAPEKWLLRSGQGWALGLERGLERHTWGDPVALAVSPLEWLRHGAGGLCILDWDAPELTYLLGVPNLVCSTREQASHLRAALSKPVRLPNISIEETRLAA